MDKPRIITYAPAYRDEVLSITRRAWTPVMEKTAQDVPRFVFDAFYPQGWQVRQEAEVDLLLRDEPQNIQLAIFGTAVAGFVGIKVHPGDSMGEIYIIAVDPSYQGRGIGRCLMDHAERIVRDAGMTMMMVETIGDRGHWPARRACEAAGYVPWPVARYFKDLS